MSKGQSLQDPFLNALRRGQIPVSVYLINGIKLHGQIESFDQFVILLRNTSSQMVVYKHAISTVVPSRPVLYCSKMSGSSNNNHHSRTTALQELLSEINNNDIMKYIFTGCFTVI